MGQPSYLKNSCRKAETRGTETSKYPEEKKSIEIPRVAASEKGLALKCIEGNRTSWKAWSKKVKIL